MAGAILLALNYFLVDRSLTQNRDEVRVAVANRLGVSPNDVETSERGEAEDVDDRALYREVQRQIADDHLEYLLTESGVALAAMALLSLGLGWLIAGRVLRPVHRMTTTARHLSESNLHERIDLDGPDDELKELADTFDAMLDRLETAFSAQRRFVADASHELRTPLSIIRAEVDVTLADPDATPGELRAMAEAIRDATKRTERLIDSLLVLARSDAGSLASEPCDLAAMVRSAAERVAPAADAPELGLDLELEPALVDGDRPLLERMVANLVDNAVLHNLDRGWISLHTRTDGNRVRAARREQRGPCRFRTRRRAVRTLPPVGRRARPRRRRLRTRVVDRRGGGHGARRSSVGGATPRRWPRSDCRSAGRNAATDAHTGQPDTGTSAQSTRRATSTWSSRMIRHPRSRPAHHSSSERVRPSGSRYDSPSSAMRSRSTCPPASFASSSARRMSRSSRRASATPCSATSRLLDPAP